MSKEIDELCEQYSARIMELDDEPLFATGTFGTFKMLSVEEYEEIQKQISVLEKQRENYRHKRNEYRNKVRVLQKQLADSEAQNKRVLEKLGLIVRSNQELEKALENAIVPKFKIGQEVYYYHIARNKIYLGYIEDIQWFAIRNRIYYRIPQLQRDYFWIREDELFATKEEALAKLEEIK